MFPILIEDHQKQLFGAVLFDKVHYVKVSTIGFTFGLFIHNDSVQFKFQNETGSTTARPPVLLSENMF